MRTVKAAHTTVVLPINLPIHNNNNNNNNNNNKINEGKGDDSDERG